MRFDRGRRRGATGTEYFLVISFVVTSVTAGAFVFTPKFRGGVRDLSNDVSVILSNHEIAGVGMNPPPTPGGAAETTAGETGGAASTSVPDDGEQPPLPRQEQCYSAGPVHSYCTESNDVSSNGSGANDNCWAVILAGMSGLTPGDVLAKCRVELGLTNDIDSVITEAYGPAGAESAVGRRTQIESFYMSQQGLSACMTALNIPNGEIPLGNLDDSVAAVDECIPAQAAVFTIDYSSGDPCGDCAGENGHVVEVTAMNDRTTCFKHSTVDGKAGNFGTECVPTSQFLASTHNDVDANGNKRGTKSFVCAGAGAPGA